MLQNLLIVIKWRDFVFPDEFSTSQTMINFRRNFTFHKTKMFGTKNNNRDRQNILGVTLALNVMGDSLAHNLGCSWVWAECDGPIAFLRVKWLQQGGQHMGWFQGFATLVRG
uniref:Uncharacterized protein n=1 Tax=Cacopsylla melanoneura TaxID=428564 RepID=A0A8D9FGG6_9HEMI